MKEKLEKIKYDLECFVADFHLLSLKDKKFRARSILWKLNLAKITPAQMIKKNRMLANRRWSKAVIKNLSDEIKSN